MITLKDDLALDADHRYWFDGRELIGVTATLKAVGLIDTEWFTEAAQLRGTYVHEACCLVDDNDLGAIDPAIAPYVAAYETFLRDAKPDWAFIEQRVCDPAMGYAGTLDRCGFLNGKWIVADVKTGPESAWHSLQLAAYARLVPHASGLKPDRYGLYLRADGTYRLRQFTNRNDERVFLAALSIAQWKQR